MSDSLVKQLLETGVHFGHKSSNWNPKMDPYIFGKKGGIHIIDVRQTIKGLLLAKRFLTRVVAGGKDVLFVGTKRQARPALENHCAEAGMPWVTERWLGGTLTNFRTIRSRLKRLDELDTLMASDDWASYSKKMASQLTRERKKIHRNLSGIRSMNNLPGAMVVIDVKRELNALREAQKLGVPTVCLIDTDANPDLADLPIPGNDDAMRAIDLIVQQLCGAITEGKTARAQKAMETKDEGDDAGPRPRRRSSRSQFSADSPAPEAPAEPAAEATDAPVAVAEAPAEPAPTPEVPAAPASEEADAGKSSGE